jgi:ATPase subunit of ABC transporter with duplicated ATPase domains
MAQILSFNSVTFYYPSSVEPVLRDITAEFHSGWTGITGDNGAGKTTFLLLALGLLEPGQGSINGAGGIYCPQRTDDPPQNWEDFFYSGDPDADRLISRLEIDAGFMERWDTLSHGERKRIQIAIALWLDPPLLAVDEPTNHLDKSARTLISGALKEYRGLGLMVSHDRSLLDQLCGNCLFIRNGSGVLRPGGISQGLAEEEKETQNSIRQREKLAAERGRLFAEADRRRREAEHSKSRLSKKNLDPNDSDSRGRINLAKHTGKDAVGTQQYKRMKNRVDRVEKSLENAATPAERKKGITLSGTRSKADRLYYCASGSIPLGNGRSLGFPELVISPGDRIALTGPNGAGKSTLIGRIREGIAPTIPVLYIPQEIPLKEGSSILDEILNEDEKARGEIISRFSRLGSDPKSLLQSRSPSPGEIRKLLVARGVFSNPGLIIMDEPTNHLDLGSITLLEETLSEAESALLLVSHDEMFLSHLTGKEWSINKNGELSVV